MRKIKNYIYNLVAFIANILNSLLLIFGIVVSKFLLLLNSKKSLNFLKNFWLLIIKSIRKPTNTLNFFIFCFKLVETFYWILILLLYTIICYCLLFFILNIFIVDPITTCNRAVLFFFIYLSFYIFLVDHDDDSLFMWDIEFDHDEYFDFSVHSWEEDDDELSAPTSSSEEDLGLSDIIDSFDELIDDQDQNESFLSSVELTDKNAVTLDKRNIVEEIEFEEEFFNDIYLFERWYTLSNEILNTIYKNRLLNSSLKKKTTHIKLYVKNASLLLNSKFFMNIKFFNLNFLNNKIIIDSKFKLINFIVNKFLLSYQLSDNLILYFRFYRRIEEKRYNRTLKKRQFGLRRKEPETYKPFLKDVQNFWGANTIQNLILNDSVATLIDVSFIKNSLISTNYNSYIFNDKFFPNLINEQSTISLGINSIADFLFIDYTLNTSLDIRKLSTNNIFLNSYPTLHLLAKDFSIKNFLTTKNILNLSAVINPKFNTDLFRIVQLIEKKIKLNASQEILFINSLIYNSTFWIDLHNKNKYLKKKLFNSILNTVLFILLKKFNNFLINQRHNKSYLLWFCFNFFETDFKILFKSNFFIKYLRINFQKIFFKVLLKFSQNIYKYSIYKNNNDFFNPELQFYFLFRKAFYFTLLPEQDWYNLNSSFSSIYAEYKSETLITSSIFSINTSISHIFLNIRKANFRSLFNLTSSHEKYTLFDSDLPINRLESAPEIRDFGATLALPYNNIITRFDVNLTDLVIKWLETSYMSHYSYSFLFRRNYKLIKNNLMQPMILSKIDNKLYNLIINKRRHIPFMQGLVDNFFYFIFYGFSYFINDKLRYSSLIGLKNNFITYFDYLSAENFYLQIINRKNVNALLFPYVNDFHKVFKNSNNKSTRFVSLLSEYSKQWDELLLHRIGSHIFELKFLTSVNFKNFKNLHYNFLLILCIINNQYTTLLRDDSLVFLKNTLTEIENKLFFSLFIKNYCIINSPKSLSLNFINFRESLFFYFSTNNFNYRSFFGKLKVNTFHLRYKDFAVLSHLANHIWLYGSYNLTRDYFFSVSDQSVEIFQDKVLLEEPYDLDLNVSLSDDEFIFRDDSGLTEILDLEIYSFNDDYYEQSESNFIYMVNYIDLWLQKNQIPLLHNEENFYSGYFYSILSLWIWCRMEWIIGGGTDYDHDSRSTALPILHELIDYEEFSDAYKNTNMETTTLYSNDFGLRFVGEDRGIFDEYFWSSSGLQAPLEEDQIYEEFAFGGLVNDPTRFEDHEEFNQYRYFIEEQSYEMMDLEGFYLDFFRHYTQKNSERRISSILKWNIFGELNHSFRLLNGPLLHFMYLKNRYQPYLVKWKKSPLANMMDIDPNSPEMRPIRYFVKQVLPKYQLFYGNYLFLPQKNDFFDTFDTFAINPFLYNKEFTQDSNSTLFIFKNLITILRFDNSFFSRWLAKQPDFGKIRRITKYFKAVREAESLTVQKERAYDILQDLLQRVSESNSTILNKSFYKKNAYERRFDFTASEYEDFAYFTDDTSETYHRLFLNIELASKHLFFYRLFEEKLHTDYQKSIFDLFNANILKSTLENSTIYGTDLIDNYQDSLEILPLLYPFLAKLSKFERLNFINNVPEFYKLCFDNLYYFLNDPYLNTNSSTWHYNIFNNPWVSKKDFNFSVYYDNFLKEHLNMNAFNSNTLEYFFLNNFYGRELDWFLSSDGDLYLEVFAMMFRWKDPYETDPYDVMKFMIMRYEQLLFGLYGSLNPQLLAQVKYDKNFLGFARLARQIFKRRPIRERIIVSIDRSQSFRTVGQIQDPIIRYPRWGGDHFYRTLMAFGRVFGNINLEFPTHTYSYLNRPLVDLNNSLRSLLNQSSPFIDYNRSFFSENLTKLKIKNNFANYRIFNADTWDRHINENFFYLATQFLENRYRFSDRIFSTHPNTYIDDALDRNTASDFFALEDETDSVWYELEEINLPETVRPYSYEIKFWENIVMSLLEYPRAMPPVIFQNWMTGGLFPYTNFILRNFKIYPKNRYLDPINDSEPFDGYRTVMEEGEVTLNYFLPVITFLYDLLLKNSISILLKFKFFSNKNFLLQNFSSGNFNIRTRFFRESLILDRLDQQRISSKFISNYFNVGSNYSVNYNYKRIIYFFKFFFNINITDHKFLNQIVHFIFFMFNSTFNLFKYLNTITNSSFLRDSFIYFSLFIVFFVLNFILWIPLVYLLTIFRNWLFYPFDLDDEDLASEDYEQFYDRNIETFTHPYGLKEIESDLNYDFNLVTTSLYNNSLLAEEILFDPIILYSVPSYQFLTFTNDLDISFKNEILFLNNIQLPGYKFTYSLFDIFDYIDNDLVCSNFKGDLPYYKRFYIEYMHVLIGARVHANELQLSFQEQSYFHYLYFFTNNPYRLLLQSDTPNQLEDLIFKNKKFIKRHNSNKNLNKFKDSFFQDEFFNEINSFSAPETKFDPKQFSFHETNANSIFKINRLDMDNLKELNLPLRTLWLNNKYLFNTLKILDFSLNLLNNNYYETLLYGELTNVSQFFKLNLISVLTQFESYFFLSRNGLVLTQYQPGDKICPIYLRFNKFNENFIDNTHLSYNRVSEDLLYLYDSNWKFNSNFSSKLKNITTSDLNLIIPFNQDGVVNFEILFAYILNLKLFFSDAIIFDESSHYDELILDFNNYELNKFYTRSFFSHFEDLEDFGESFDYTDWLKLIEEQKEWSIYLENDRFIPLLIDDELLVDVDTDMRFLYSAELSLRRKIRPIYSIKRVYDFNTDLSSTSIKGTRSIFFIDGRYRIRNRGRHINFKSRLKYGTTVKKFFLDKLNSFRIGKNQTNNLNSVKIKNFLKYYRYRRLPLIFQLNPVTNTNLRSNFILFDEPKYQLYFEIYFNYAFTPSEQIQFVNQFQVPYNFTEYSVSYNDQDIRFLEVFNFPSKDFVFSSILIHTPVESLFYYNSWISRLRKNSPKVSKQILSNDVFYNLIIKQYLSTNIHQDIFTILTPEGRSINKRFSKLCSAQMYAYTNLNLNIRYIKNQKINFTNNLFFSLNQNLGFNEQFNKFNFSLINFKNTKYRKMKTKFLNCIKFSFYFILTVFIVLCFIYF